MAVWQTNRLTPAQLEHRWREAARLVRTRPFSEARIARDLGVPRYLARRYGTPPLRALRRVEVNRPGFAGGSDF